MCSFILLLCATVQPINNSMLRLFFKISVCRILKLLFAILITGYKCGGSCSIGYRCIADGEELAKEIKKMHDDLYHIASCYCTHRCPFNSETMEVSPSKENTRENRAFFQSIYALTSRIHFFFSFPILGYCETMISNKIFHAFHKQHFLVHFHHHSFLLLIFAQTIIYTIEY